MTRLPCRRPPTRRRRGIRRAHLPVVAILAGLPVLVTLALATDVEGQEPGTRARTTLVPAVGDARLRVPPTMGADADPTGSPVSPDSGIDRTALYSLVLPGAGQLALGQKRGVAYAALEVVAWYLHLDRRGSGRELRDGYRTLAWEAARDGQGPRVVDDFEYYERLSVWTRSGAWDVDPGVEGLQPEADPTTYNGSIWRRARDIFFGPDPEAIGPDDPEWAEALAYYRARAYPPELAWDWSGAGDAMTRFGNLVAESDDDFREATVMLGVVAANHLLSAADAFVSSRLRDATGDRVDGTLALIPRGIRGEGASVALALRLAVGR